MNITLTGTKVSMDSHTLAFQKNNLVDSMVITVDTDAAWQYKLDVKYPCKDSNGKEMVNVIDLTRVGDTCTAILQADMLPFNGKYTMQLRGINGEQVYHTETFDAWVKYSIDPRKVYDPVPSEFYQIEANITELNNHPPKPGDSGYWMIWNINTKQYEQSDIPLPEGELPDIDESTKGKYLTNDGSEASWAEVDALPSISTATKDMVLGNDGKKAMWVEQSGGGSGLPTISETTKGKFLTNDGSTADWADTPKETMRVNFTVDEQDNITADKSWNEVAAVVENDGLVIATLSYDGGEIIYSLTDLIGEPEDSVRQMLFRQTVVFEVDNSDFTSTETLNWIIKGGNEHIELQYKEVDFNNLKYISYANTQSLTPAQKLQARTNIGLTPVAKTDEMTQSVGLDAATGELYTKPAEADNTLGITSATVGQIAKITAVDNDGQPTAWEATEIPSGDKEWELIDTIPLTADVTTYDIANFSAYRKIAISMEKPITTDGSGSVFLRIFSLSNDAQSLASYTIDGSFVKGAYGYIEIAKDEPFLRYTQLYRNNLGVPGSGGGSVPNTKLSLANLGAIRLILPESYSQNFDGTGNITIWGQK